jgi:hypothetical protein
VIRFIIYCLDLRLVVDSGRTSHKINHLRELSSKLNFNFSHTFPGAVWNTLSVPDTDLLIIEVRNEDKREATFSVLDIRQNQFRWKDKIFDETWWIGLTAATPDILMLHLYQNTDNPDEKSLLGWHIQDQKLLWKLNDFRFNYLDDKYLYGCFTNNDMEVLAIDFHTGEIDENVRPTNALKENIMLQMPFQYVDGNVHFETVKSFLTSKLKVTPILGVEYLEYERLLFISYLVLEKSLANYLVVFTDEGELLLHEKLDDQLKGLGLDTFFILSGCLVFVRNKSEMISYRIV